MYNSAPLFFKLIFNLSFHPEADKTLSPSLCGVNETNKLSKEGREREGKGWVGMEYWRVKRRGGWEGGGGRKRSGR